MKNKKLISILLLVIVITTLFVPLFSFCVSAVEVNEVYYFSVPDGNNVSVYPGLTNPGDEITVNCSFQIPLLDNYDYIGITFLLLDSIFDSGVNYIVRFIRSDGLRVNLFGGLDGYSNPKVKFIKFLSPVDDSNFNLWINTNCSLVTESDMYLYDLGYNYGYSDGEAEGYEAGKQDGIVIGENSSFGNNLIGDTLSAPVKALDSFVLYETSSGFEITLWHIFSTVLAVGLTIWFIKMFAGG